MVDEDRLRRLLSRIEEGQAQLDRLAAMERATLGGDRDRLASVKYHFVVTIEACVDIAHHLIASERLRAPRDNADSFGALQEAGLVEEALARKLALAVRFRNRLVHVYWDVDDELVLDYLRDERPIFSQLACAVAALLGAGDDL